MNSSKILFWTERDSFSVEQTEAVTEAKVISDKIKMDKLVILVIVIIN